MTVPVLHDREDGFGTLDVAANALAVLVLVLVVTGLAIMEVTRPGEVPGVEAPNVPAAVLELATAPPSRDTYVLFDDAAIRLNLETIAAQIVETSELAGDFVQGTFELRPAVNHYVYRDLTDASLFVTPKPPTAGDSDSWPLATADDLAALSAEIQSRWDSGARRPVFVVYEAAADAFSTLFWDADAAGIPLLWQVSRPNDPIRFLLGPDVVRQRLATWK